MAARRYATTADARAWGSMLPTIAWLETTDTRTGQETSTALRTRRAAIMARFAVAQDKLRRPWLAHRIRYVRARSRDLQAETDGSVAR